MVPYPSHAGRVQGGANATRLLAKHDMQVESDYSFLKKISQPIEQRTEETSCYCAISDVHYIKA